jgi:hypothetical protein
LVQKVGQSSVTAAGASMVVVVPLSPQATRTNIRSGRVRMGGIVGEVVDFCN